VIFARLAGAGAALPASLMGRYSALLGADLSTVRVHSSGEASRAASRVAAVALTHGVHIAFASGAYREAEADQDPVLAHVVQSLRAPDPATPEARRRAPDEALEREAEAGAVALLAGHAFGVGAGSPARVSW
jgi:hypothetical protein